MFKVERTRFGKKLKFLRESKGLTQEQLSEKLGMTQEFIARIETAKSNPSFITIFKIAKVLEVRPKELFDPEINSR